MNIMNEFKPFMLSKNFFTCDDFLSSVSTKHTNASVMNKPIVVSNKKEEYYTIKEDDVLFWMTYILKHDYEQYNLCKRSFQFEKQLKFMLIEQLKDCKAALKEHKLRLSLIIDDLANASVINTDTLIALCCLYKKNIFLYKRKVGVFYTCKPDSAVYHSINVEDKQMHIEPSTHEQLSKKYILVSNLDKPLKNITSYKKQDLIEYAGTFNIEITKNGTKKQKTKQELYQEILAHI